MKKRKIIASLLLVALVFSLLSACGKGEDPTDGNTESTEVATKQNWSRDRFTVSVDPSGLQFKDDKLIMNATVASGIDTVDDEGNPNDGIKKIENLRLDVFVITAENTSEKIDQQENAEALKSEEIKIASAKFTIDPFEIKKEESKPYQFTFEASDVLHSEIDLSKVVYVRIGLGI